MFSLIKVGKNMNMEIFCKIFRMKGLHKVSLPTLMTLPCAAVKSSQPSRSGRPTFYGTATGGFFRPFLSPLQGGQGTLKK